MQSRQNLAKSLLYVSFLKLYMLNTLRIRKIFYTLFDKHNGSRKAKATLEKACLMNHILPRTYRPIGLLIFCGENQDSKGAF